MLTFGSICSGIEAASVAWEGLMKPAWVSEIDPFCNALLEQRHPTTPNYGDLKNLSHLHRGGLLPPVGVLIGGTPCQSFSVAGNRGGLNDERGCLSLTFAELANQIKPKVVVWENVPGVLSDKGNAYGEFITLLSGSRTTFMSPRGRWPKVGYIYGPAFTLAWRILDAQYFGVPQRRRRVFLVACPTGSGVCPADILFERKSLSGYTQQGEAETESVAGFTAGSFGSYREGVGTLKASGGGIGGGSETLVVSPIHYRAVNSLVPSQGSCIGEAGDNGYTLTSSGTHIVGVTPIHDKTTRYAGATGKGSGNGFGVSLEGAPSPTMTSGDKHAVFVQRNQRGDIRESDLSGTISAQGSGHLGLTPPVYTGGIIRT